MRQHLHIAVGFLLILISETSSRYSDGGYEEAFDVNEITRDMGDSVYLKNEIVCSRDIEVRNEVEMKHLDSCTVVEGDVVIATVHFKTFSSRWYFPKLKEITGKLIVYYTNLPTLGIFPNLVIIRGRQPLMGYSLVVMETVLTHMHLPQLRLVQQGGVRVAKNHLMCHVRTIDWSLIINLKSSADSVDRRSMILVENNRGLCPDLCNQSLSCHKAMINEKRKELCWSPNVCQSVCDSSCTKDNRACWMNDTQRCCHEECLGGCYGNGTELCVSCKNFIHDGRCVKECPPGFYQYLGRRCVSKEYCFSKLATDPIYYKRNISFSLYQGKCVALCPSQHRRNEVSGYCDKCEPACPKRCGEANVYYIKDLKDFWGCRSVRKLYISIRDGGEASELMEQLRENLGGLEEVEDFVKIVNTGYLKTLSFLSNLRHIGYGNANSSDALDDHPGKKTEQNVFEVLANDRLQSLWRPGHGEKVHIYGRVYIHLNRQLCANKIFGFLDNYVDLMQGNLSEQERTFIRKANGDLMPCNVSTINLTIVSVTARNVDVRWSPVDLTERDFFVTLLMIKATTKNISLADDRASCEKSSWQIHEATACPKSDESGTLGMRECSLTVPKLNPATRYAVYMESKTTQGDHGAISPVVYFTTATEPPTQVRDIQIEALTSNSLKVSWYPPRYPNGRVTRYMIWYRPMKLIGNEFSGRDFCTSRLMGHQETSRRSHEGGATTLTGQQLSNGSVCTSCAECLRICDKNPLGFKNSDDVSHSFEDSLQNHIFVKSKYGSLPQIGTTRPGLAAAYSSLDKTGNGSSNSTGLSDDKMQNLDFQSADLDVDAFGSAFTTGTALPISTPTTPTSQPEVTTEREEIKPRRKSRWEKKMTVNADTNHVIFTNLQHFTEYIFAIRACHDPPEASAEMEGDMMEATYPQEDDISSVEYGTKVCSKMERANHRTLPSDEADRVDDATIEVNKELGLRVLWSRPKTPNGIVIHYWFRYRKKDPDVSERSNTNWNWRCLPLLEWYSYYKELRQHRLQDKARSRSKRDLEEDGEDAAMDAQRGGCLCRGASFSPGLYEFSIKAVSLAGNGSWSKTLTFTVEGDTRSQHDVIVNIIVPVIVVMVMLLCCILLSYVLFRKRRREAQEVIFSNPEYQKIPQPDEWEIPQTDIVYYNERALGKGHFGVVVKGFVKNLQTPAANFFEKTDTILAAIKTVRKDASFEEKIEFLSEANRMKTFHSYHVVQLLGVVSRMETRDAMPQVVMEFMSHGDLASYLNQIKEKEAINMLSEAKILLWASQIADGMAYLSSNRVVHRDLAARNCLVDSQEVVKIADFGLTRELYYTEEAYKKRRNRGGVIGSFMWMAPESLSRGNFSSLSDVWSYGVVLWEIATLGARPYPNMSAMAVKDFVLLGNNLLTGDHLWDNSWKKLCPLSVLDLMRRCFMFRDKDRPSFLDILFSLDPYIDERFIKFSFYLSQV